MCKQDLIIEKISALADKIDANTDHTRRELDAMNAHLGTINSSISNLTVKVDTQNGRVSKMESYQRNCPGNELQKTFSQYQSELRPIYVLATNMRMIAFIVVGAALAFNLVGTGIEWLINLLNL